MKTLVFQLDAPLSSWGDVAVGSYRPSSEYPSLSAIQGFLGAALGIDREDEKTQKSLQEGTKIAFGVLDTGTLLRDYHTSQVPSSQDLKKSCHILLVQMS